MIRKILAPVLLALLAALAASSPVAGAAPPSPTASRAFKLSGSPADAAVLAHAEFCVRLGFNAVWVYSHEAGAWTPESAPRGPFLENSFLEFAAWCRERSVRMIVSVNPSADSRGRFVFENRDGERRIRKFFGLLGRAGVRDVVLSFDDQPLRLTEIRDIVRYGRSTAPAHLDLVRRIERHLGRRDKLWLCASAYCDSQLGDGKGAYARAFLAGLPALARHVGIVWTGSAPISPSIPADSVQAIRERLGQRDILLYDNFAAIEAWGYPIAAYLGPLRDRDPGLLEKVSVYMACPLYGPGASRLSLLTVADWLENPGGYDADASWRRAIARLGGSDRDAADALRIQALEWRGWDEGRAFRPWDPADSEEAAATLDDPALSAEWRWTVDRYPDRMAALSRLDDGPFRDSLLDLMGRRLAIANVVPAAIEYRARERAGRTDLEPILEEIHRQRAEASKKPSVLGALDRFLGEAGIPLR
jgi:hypothetical protein